MTRARHIWRLLAITIAALVTTLTLVLALGLRPTLPALPQDLDSPIPLSTLRQLVSLLAWLAVIAYLFRLLCNLLHEFVHATRPRHGRETALTQSVLLSRRQGRDRAAGHPQFATPRSLALQLPLRGVLEVTNALPAHQATSNAGAQIAKATPCQRPRRSIKLLGPIQIEGTKQRGRRRLRSLTVQLLAYLALHPEGATVDQLVGTLLPDHDPDASRQRLWQSASEARRVLGDAFQRDHNSRYQLDRSQLAIDIDELTRLLRAGGRLTDPALEHKSLEQALALFRGEPLAGADFPWAGGDARHLQATYVSLLQRAARVRLEAKDARGALEAAERAIQLDQLNEPLWRLAMQADAALGLRESITQRYEWLRSTLDEQLGLEPDSQTRVLYRELLGQA